LTGDLILRGIGNTDLDWEPFAKLLDTLRIRQGIRHIAGDLIIDRTFFHPIRPDLGMPRFDDSVEFRYNVIPDALLLNHNLVQLEFDASATEVKARITPALDRVAVASEMQLIDGKCADWEDGWKEPRQRFADDGTVTIVLRGTFPRQCRARTEVNVLDRVIYADRLFRALWAERGGTLAGSTRDAAASVASGARLLAEHRSRPLAELVRDVNKRSDNTFTRMLFLTLGEVPAVASNGVAVLPTPVTGGEAPSPRSSSISKANGVVRDWFSRAGIDPEGMVLDNGSGLSRSERITATQLAALLKAAEASNWAPEFLASLPIVGLDGTMRNRLRQSPAAGRARIKTGTLRDVVAVAGYVPNAQGERQVVVMMINHANASSSVARPVADALIEWVAAQ
jgi:D-alanyl-D-alanine carboxypeptidase/D-alanyl-D-alanine-endopeptidase (penicillin-binding protein 4)